MCAEIHPHSLSVELEYMPGMGSPLNVRAVKTTLQTSPAMPAGGED